MTRGSILEYTGKERGRVVLEMAKCRECGKASPVFRFAGVVLRQVIVVSIITALRVTKR